MKQYEFILFSVYKGQFGHFNSLADVKIDSLFVIVTLPGFDIYSAGDHHADDDEEQRHGCASG